MKEENWSGFLRVAAYCRVSTEKDVQQNSLVSQRRYFQNYIENHTGWRIAKIYYDEGISGTLAGKREGFQDMIRDAMNGQMDLILTKEVSRFARNTVDTLAYTRKLRTLGIGVIFIMDHIDTREPDGELRLTIMASIAQEESRKISERVKWGQKRRMEQGVVFGRDLLGYRVKDGKLTIHEGEASIVRAIFHKYTNEGKGSRVIARELIEEGMRPMNGKLWSNVMILRVLRNEKYVGDLCQKKTITPDYLTHQKLYNHGEEEMVYLKDHHEPIISRALWNRTCQEIKRRTPDLKGESRYSSRHWCSGKVICGECGTSYVSRTKKLKNGELYKSWRCRNAVNYGRKKVRQDEIVVGCDSGLVNDRTLRTCVKYCLDLISVNYEEVKKEILQEINATGTISNYRQDTNQLERERKVLEEKKQKAIDLALEDMITREDLSQQLKYYNTELKNVKIRIEKIKEDNCILTGQIIDREQYVAAVDEILTFDESNEFLFREVLEKIIVYPGQVMEVWLRGVHMGIRLCYQSSGRGRKYETKILEAEVV